MRTSIRCIAVLCLLFTVSLVRGAQTAAWEVVIYDHSSAQFSLVSADGVLALATLPPAERAYAEEHLPFEPAAISPDRSYIALKYGYVEEIRLVDVRRDVCCQSISVPLESPEFVDVAFSPDSTQLAVSLVSVTEQVNFSGWIVILDLATNTVVQQISTAPFDPQIAAIQLEWLDTGINFVTSCWGCDAGEPGTRTFWSPEDGSQMHQGVVVNPFSRRLPITGESLLAEDHPNFPGGIVPEGLYIPPKNVITYYNGDTTNVVYFNPDDLDLPPAEWVLDGRAFLIAPFAGDEVVLVYRDGRQETIPITPGSRFLAGTPDGWLMADEASGVSYYRENADGEIEVTPLEGFSDSVQAVDASPLGATAVGLFPALEIPEPTTCPGALASRLGVNRLGRVLPGDPNNLRAEANTNNEQVGQIPADGVFNVLEGPVCAEDYVWWRIDYQGTIGWTVESSADTYWLEPAG
jgi:hypothetical protein